MITKKDVQYIAHLSRIHLAEDEVASLTKNLEGILTYIEKLKKLDVKDVKPTSHVLPLENVFREDSVRASLPQNAVMDMAVEKNKGSFKVPQVIE